MKKLLLLLALLPAFRPTSAQTFTSGGGPVPDNNTLTSFPTAVSGLAPGTINGAFGLESVCVTITHPYVGDLQVQLRAPNGAVVDLSLNNGGSGANYAGTCFSSTAATAVTAGSAPFGGTFRPQGALGTVNNGQNANGTWALLVRDTQSSDAGSVVGWQLTFGTQPATPAGLISSNLPIVVINTGGRVIVDDPKTDAYMGIISHGPGQRNYLTDAFTDYHNKIGIELRGS